MCEQDLMNGDASLSYSANPPPLSVFKGVVAKAEICFFEEGEEEICQEA